jgi:glucosamine 6-phosphate synthetase-like amidotransferase/phosphosugar isomerase protein
VNILEGAYSFVLISILEPNCMYIVKNTGTMVIGIAPQLAKSAEEPPQTLENG